MASYGSYLVIRSPGGANAGTGQTIPLALQNVFDWSFLPGTLVDLCPIVYLTSASGPVTLRCYFGIAEDTTTVPVAASWTIPATPLGLVKLAPVQVAKPSGVNRIWWTVQCPAGSAVLNDITVYAGFPTTAASVWYPFQNGNAGFNFGLGESLSGGIAHRFVLDFSRFPSDAQLSVCVAGLLKGSAGVFRVRVGGTFSDVTGTAILTHTEPMAEMFGWGHPTSKSATFANQWSGPQIVKLTAQNTGGGGSGSFLGGPTVVFKAV